MLQKLKQAKKEDGFTIIEVLIVLAIGAAIIVIVLLAVPALNRNSRNTQRKNDVQAILGGVNEFISNNAGKTPTAFDAANNDIIGVTGTTAAGTKLNYYDAVAFELANPVQTALTADGVKVVVKAQCGAAGATVAGSARQIAVQYTTEGTRARTATCQDS
jgi:prepilin-type N-terminal cleavage/methylation domain-containing protein